MRYVCEPWENDDLFDPKFTKEYLKIVELHEVDGGHKISGAALRDLMKEPVYKMEHERSRNSWQ